MGRLAVQRLVSLLGDAKTPVFVAAVHLKGRLDQTDQAGDQGNARAIIGLGDRAISQDRHTCPWEP